MVRSPKRLHDNQMRNEGRLNTEKWGTQHG